MALTKKNRFLLVIFMALVVLIAVAFGIYYPKLDIITGYSSKNMASSVFLAGRDFTYTDTTDNEFSPVNLAQDRVDFLNKTATSTIFGLKKRTALFREGLGGVLLPLGYDPNTPFLSPKRRRSISDSLPFPYGNASPKDSVFSEIDYAKLQEAVENAFDKPEIKRTRSVIVVYKDHIVAEKYAEGLGPDDMFLGWSMSKSVLATLYGILQHEGRLELMDKAPIDNWQQDERATITLNDLLHMSSGLEWEEDYQSISDVTKMLFLAEDMTAIQAEKPLRYIPGSHWNYSSGTTNLLSGILHHYLPDQQTYLNFPYAALIDRIGMTSMVMEADVKGNYVGSSYVWAAARDWAKFGLLYLHEGNWNGDQLFNKSWVDYVRNPVADSGNQYGGHFWLNSGRSLPDVPREVYSCNGYQGQRIYIYPSKELVVVRLGLAEEPDFDFNTFLSSILAAF